MWHDGMFKSIYLTGPDGSGKTTIANLYRAHLQKRGYVVTVYWIRGTHLIASVLAKCLSKLSLFQGSDNPYYGISIPPSLRSLWIIIELLSVVPHILVRNALSRFSIVIGDRGLLDFLVWLIVTLNYPQLLRRITGRFLAGLALKEMNIYVKAHPVVLCKRAVNTPLDFLNKEIKCYEVLARYYTICTIDTTHKKPCESLKELIRCVMEFLGNKEP